MSFIPMSLNKLILLDFPSGYKLGMDLREWTVGPNFKGIKDIPNGPHYLYYGSNASSSNIGFLFYLSGAQTVVKKWSTTDEDFKNVDLSEDDIIRYNNNEEEINSFLGKYYMDNHMDWFSLSNFITSDLIDNLMPDCARIYSVEQLISEPSSIEDRINNIPKLDKDGLIELECDPTAKIHFTQIPRFLHPENTLNLTKYMLDKTYTLENVLSSKPDYQINPKAFLGEFQFAFITYNLSFVLAGFEQWMRIIELLSSCIEAVTKYHDLYTSFITVLHFQLKLTEEDFADISTNVNKFFLAMKKLFEVILDESNATDELKIKSNGLKEVLMKKYD